MATTITDEEILKEAKQRVKARRDFYRHLGAYLVVNAVLIIIWALSGDAGRQTYGPGDWTGGRWFLWPLCIWGVFVMLNFLQVFVFKTSVSGEKRAIDKEVEKIKKE